jgi:hypothetical protein
VIREHYEHLYQCFFAIIKTRFQTIEEAVGAERGGKPKYSFNQSSDSVESHILGRSFEDFLYLPSHLTSHLIEVPGQVKEHKQLFIDRDVSISN